MSRERRTFDPEFKKEASRLVQEEGRKVSEIARDLGVGDTVLRRWVQKYQDSPTKVFLGKGSMQPLEDENRKLKQKLSKVEREREILKKALAIFSTEPR